MTQGTLCPVEVKPDTPGSWARRGDGGTQRDQAAASSQLRCPDALLSLLFPARSRSRCSRWTPACQHTRDRVVDHSTYGLLGPKRMTLRSMSPRRLPEK
jgi:hypothetical protein